MMDGVDDLACLADSEDVPQRPRYSVTSLMVYEACPYQYYETFVLGRPPPISAGMRRGTDVHGLIARHLRRPALIPEEGDPETRRLFETFLSSRFNVAPVAVEERFVHPFMSADVSGRIDALLPDQSGGLEVIDFKSGSAPRPEELASRLQLPVYALAASRLHDVPPDRVAYTYFFLGDAAEVRLEPDPDNFQPVTDRVEAIVRAIEAGQFEPRPGCECYACRKG